MTHTRVVAGYRVPRHPALERVAHLARGGEDHAERRQLRVMRAEGRRHLPQPAVLVPAQADGRELDDQVRAAPRAVVHALQQAAQPRLPPTGAWGGNYGT